METLTTFDPDIGKHFAAFLSKIMTPLRDWENKKDFYRAVFEHGVGELTCCYYKLPPVGIKNNTQPYQNIPQFPKPRRRWRSF